MLLRRLGRRRITVSAALIVKNEANHLPDCLASLDGIVDEIIVVDTGSSDTSRELAVAAGAVLDEIVWPEDFAAARNHALERCTGDWILYIDADERLRPIDPDRLRSALSGRSDIGATLNLHARTGHDAYRELRLFRNHPQIRFRGVIHETIWPGIEALMLSEGSTIAETEAVLDHVGYDGPQEHKHPRNLPLLRKALAQDPDHVYCWWHLGATLVEMGEIEAGRDAWYESVAALGRVGVRRPADSLAFIALLNPPRGAADANEALFEQALTAFPADPMLRWLRGRFLLEADRQAEAIDVLSALLTEIRADGLSRDFGYDETTFGSGLHGLLGRAYHDLGQHTFAATHFAEAEIADPTNLEFRARRVLSEHLST
ncbi:MAG: glycosyltransferase [Actinomycetia bacterium]|nr:glycosyltransferase [Actinomycetes bacterium]